MSASKYEGRAGSTWATLALRPALFLVLQSAVALALSLAGVTEAWRVAADWWLAWLTIANLANLAWLAVLVRREGREWLSQLRPRRGTLGGDLRWTLLAFVVAAPLGALPNLIIGRALWGSAEVGAALSFRPVPIWAAWAMLALFPVSQGLAELPTYFGYVMPRLQTQSGRRWLPLLICAAVLSAQHCFLPLLCDGRFILWRLTMFLPFALWIGFVLDRRPALLPYLAAGHALLDASLPWLVLQASAR